MNAPGKAVSTDFNDVAKKRGRRAVADAIEAAQPPAPAPATPVDPIADALAQLSEDPGALFEPGILDTLKRMRETEPARFARARAQAKATRAISMVEFDRLTVPDNAKPEERMFPEVEPWPDPVDGAALLDEIHDTIRRYVVADMPTLIAATLWPVHTWLIDVLTVSPIANITAPEKRCGKSVLLTVLGKLSNRPMQTANVAPAALFRAIEAWRPTLLIDEVDTFLREYEEARGIINAGFTRDSAVVLRCVGDNHDVAPFSVWGAKALCGIGKIADTLADRSVPLVLRRRKVGEVVENLRHADPAQWERLQAQLVRWTDDHRDQIARARPAPAEGLHDRAADAWEPLLAIADTAGGTWPSVARFAAQTIHGIEGEPESIGAELLGDIRDAFGQRDRMKSADLCAALIEDEEAPWATWNRGRPMSVKQLANRLREYGITSKPLRFPLVSLSDPAVARGYLRSDFEDAFTRYIP